MSENETSLWEQRTETISIDDRNLIVEKHIWLVRHVVGRIIQQKPWLRGWRDDFVDEGNVALVRAAESFSRGNFIPYASTAIRNNIRNWLRYQGRKERWRIQRLKQGRRVVDVCDRNAESLCDRHVASEGFEECTKQLSFSERKFLFLKYCDGFNVAESGKIMGLRVDVAEELHTKLMRRMRESLK